MSAISNVMSSIFGGSQNLSVPASPTPAPAPTAAPSPAPAPTPAAPPPAPLSKFHKLWQNAPADPNAPRPPTSFLDNVDPTKIGEAALKVPFGQIVTPEMQAAISKGGAEGAQALVQAMERMTQEGYGKGALTTTELIKQAIKEERAKWETEFAGKVRATQIKGTAAARNPQLADPALAPIAQAIEERVALQNPNASPAEVAEMVEEYFQGALNTLLGKNPNEKTVPTGRGEDVDWDSFAST